jgi:hypothetical protein
MSKRSFSFFNAEENKSVAEQIMVYQNMEDERNFSEFYQEYILHRDFSLDFNNGNETRHIRKTLHDIILFMQLDSVKRDQQNSSTWAQLTLAKQSRQAFLAQQNYPRLGENDHLLEVLSTRRGEYSRFGNQRQYLQSLKNATLIGMQIYNAIFNIFQFETCSLFTHPNINESPIIAECFFLSYAQKYLNLPSHVNWNAQEELHPLNYIHQIISAMLLLKNILVRIWDTCKSLEQRPQPQHIAQTYWRPIYDMIRRSTFSPAFKQNLSEFVQVYIQPMTNLNRQHLKYIFKDILGEHFIYEPHQNVLIEEPEIENERDFIQKMNDLKRRCKRFAHFIEYVPTLARNYAEFMQTNIGHRLDSYFHLLNAQFPENSTVL